jgi:putative flippase GtrA
MSRGLSESVSVVVPTRNEAGNVDALLDRLASLPSDTICEVVFVDDSDDETPQVVARAAHTRAFDVRLVHREPPERTGGLAGAVVAGIRRASAGWVAVMDGDLQHPPEAVGTMLATATARDADIVVATRYADGGDHDGLGRFRTGLSRGSTLAAKAMFPRTLAGVSDPMSGFFLVRRDAIDCRALRPRGFKILLEILLRHPRLMCAETPYEFEARAWGQTKASLRQGLAFAEQLLDIRLQRVVSRPGPTRRIGKFALIGLSGAIVNEAVLALLVETHASGYIVAAVVATQFATLWNFVLLQRHVFDDAKRGPLVPRLAGFFALANALFAVSLPMLAFLVSGLGVNYAIANLFVIGVQFALRLVVSDRIIWARKNAPMAVVPSSTATPAPAPVTARAKLV